MKSYQITSWGQPLEELEVPIPKPTGSEVLIRITSCGVCHSDIHIWDGFFDLGGGKRITLEERGLGLPFTMGTNRWEKLLNLVQMRQGFP